MCQQQWAPLTRLNCTHTLIQAADGKDNQAQEDAAALPTHQAPPAAGVYHLVSLMVRGRCDSVCNVLSHRGAKP